MSIQKALHLKNLSPNEDLGAFYYGFVGGAPLPDPQMYRKQLYTENGFTTIL
jgi:hypothetical protein